MGPPSYTGSVVDRNVVTWHIPCLFLSVPLLSLVLLRFSLFSICNFSFALFCPYFSLSSVWILVSSHFTSLFFISTSLSLYLPHFFSFHSHSTILRCFNSPFLLHASFNVADPEPCTLNSEISSTQHRPTTSTYSPHTDILFHNT